MAIGSETLEQTENSAVRLQDRLSPAARFVYVENTYHDSAGRPSRFAGAEMVVRSGKWAKDVDVVGMNGGFRMEIPKTAKRVEWLDDETERYEIVGMPGYFVTIRFVR